jgi:hypothetical protein
MAGTDSSPRISGNYLEARTSDVYTGPCVANGEVNLSGKQAVLAWHVARGEWNGAKLDDLSVVAVLRASATLGDPFAAPGPIRSVLVIDERATDTQRAALVAFAKEIAGDLLGDVVAVSTAPVETRFDAAAGEAVVVAGKVAEVRTRGLCHHDKHCGNEEVYYPPLTDVKDAVPAVATANIYRGADLGGTWSSPGKRSAFVGTFVR